MKNLILLIALVALQVSGFPQQNNPAISNQNTLNGHPITTPAFAHDIALVKPLINTNDSSGGYYSEYYGDAFNFMYCGAVVKNMGTAGATHVYMEMNVVDYNNTITNTFYSDTIGLLNPGETATVNIPGQLTFQPLIYSTTQLIFIAKSDAVDENPGNDQDTVPFTHWYGDIWSQVSRSIYMTTSFNLGQSGNFQPGDFLGFKLSTKNTWHQLVYLKVYIPEPWQGSPTITAKVYMNGHLFTTAPLYLPNPPVSGWASSDGFLGFPPIFQDSLYYIGFEISYSPGLSFMIGTDTASFHNFGAETVANIGGNWTTLNFVPLIQLICDPEGIEERGNHSPARVFPNPAKEALYIEQAGDSKIEIYDLNGKLVLTDMQPASSRKLDVTGLAPGIYLLRMISRDKTDNRKIVVE